MGLSLVDFFKKKINREINGVIKADEFDALENEVDEYVLTDEVAKRMENFLEEYNNYHKMNGVWISGFFGSGKSHLLKMLAILLENSASKPFPNPVFPAIIIPPFMIAF